MINPKLTGMSVLGATAAIIPQTLAVKAIAKRTGKPVGIQGSYYHVLTNDKLDKGNKKAALKEINKESNKLMFKSVKLCAELAGAAAVATSCSPKFSKTVATKLTKLPVIKNIINQAAKATTSGKLPAPAKAAIAVGALALAAITPITMNIAGAKAGYIESQHETK